MQNIYCSKRNTGDLIPLDEAKADFSLSTRQKKRSARESSVQIKHRALPFALLRLLVQLSRRMISRVMLFLRSALPYWTLPLLPLLLWPGNGPVLDSLERLYQQGTLRVIMATPTDVHSQTLHPSNIMIELLQTFANELQVGLKITTLSQAQLQQATQSPPDNVDLIATHLTQPNSSQLTQQLPLNPRVRYTPAILSIDHFLVHHKHHKPSGLLQTANQLRHKLDSPRATKPPAIALQPLANQLSSARTHIFDVFQQISARQVPFTLAFSHEYNAYKHFVDDLQAQPLGTAYSFHWGFNRLQSTDLFNTANSFIKRQQTNGALDAIEKRFFWNHPTLNQIERNTFLKRVEERLPRYSAAFKQAGSRTGIDWRLLAAIAYQESHWNPRAISPTGVRGIMMLTRAAAREVGVKNRVAIRDSIEGGATYFKRQKNRLPAYIPEPDRTWMALAAYNLGAGTVLKAIKKAQTEGGSPTDWFVVREYLETFKKDIPVRKGIRYLSGAQQGIHYVKNIRLFYDLLQRPNLLDNSHSPPPINLAQAQNTRLNSLP